jgi:hypothetical protein
LLLGNAGCIVREVSPLEVCGRARCRGMSVVCDGSDRQELSATGGGVPRRLQQSDLPLEAEVRRQQKVHNVSMYDNDKAKTVL